MKVLLILAGIIGVAICCAFLFGILGVEAVMNFFRSQDKGGD